MERCKYELFVEKYFGLNPLITNQETKMVVDFGQLVDLLASFDNSDNSKLPIQETPVLVGYLIRDYGYNGFKPIEKGTPVYSFEDRYYFEMQPLNGGNTIRQKFYKSDLSHHIDFVDNLKS